ncbi:MAG TPA: hypothetical protein VKU82_12975 [Planctomycetaceae bacterium]|nr:hypothetical protein [Planctomycetaceae bacterium]
MSKKKKTSRIDKQSIQHQQNVLLALKNRIVDLRFVRMENGNASREAVEISPLPSNPGEAKYDIEITATFAGKNQETQGAQWLLQFITFSLVAFYKTFKQPILVSAKYCAGFEFKPDAVPPTEEEVQVLGQAVTVSLVWPYWREFVQSMSTRMGFPALPMPMQHGEITGKWSERRPTAL